MAPTARRTAGAFALLLTLVTLTACGGSDEAARIAPSSSSSSAAPAADGTADTPAPYTGEQACAFLEQSLPDITKDGNETSAQLATVLALSTFFDAHGGLEGADAYAFDDVVAKSCPGTHQKVLDAMGRTSIGGL